MKVAEGVREYVTWKRIDGCKFESGAATLINFSKSVGDTQFHELRTDHVLEYLNRTPILNATWRLRYWVIYRFFEHWIYRDVISAFTMPPPKRDNRQSFKPYIFTVADLRNLLNTASTHKRKGTIYHPYTLRTMILFLYATGSSIGELSDFRLKNFDAVKGTIQFEKASSGQFRKIPIGDDLCEELRCYGQWRVERESTSSHFFIDKKGRPITPALFSKNFKQVRRLSGVQRRDGSRYQPRLADLKFTFAVHRITKWIEDGADLNRMLPALAAYMGQSGLGATQRYLFLTPERFRKDLDKLSPLQGKGRWSDDAELMSFLSSLGNES